MLSATRLTISELQVGVVWWVSFCSAWSGSAQHSCNRNQRYWPKITPTFLLVCFLLLMYLCVFIGWMLKIKVYTAKAIKQNFIGVMF